MPRRFVLWLALALAFASGSGAETLLTVQSQPGEPVASGLVQTFLPADGPFSASRNFDEGVSLFFDGTDNWYLDFAADGALPLAVGSYPNAIGFGDNAPGQNGLEIARGGSSCGSLRGAFQVHEVVYGAGDEITSFAADFVQRCVLSAKTMSGAIRFNSSDALPDAYDDDGDGAIEIGDNCPGVPNADQHDGDLDLVGDLCDPSAQASFILFDSEEGHYVGQGLRQHFNTTNAIFRFDAEQGEVQISFGEDYWHIDLSAPGGSSPGVGVYENATRFGSDLAPSLDVGGDGRGCNESSGRFEVFEAEYGPDGEVLVFSADFEHYCGILAEAALRGSMRWRATPRPAPPGDLDGDGWLLADDNCPGVPNPPQYDADADGRGDGCGLAPEAQKCVNDFNKSVAAVAKAQSVSNLACLKNAQKGATEKLGVPATAQDCLSNDVGGKTAGSVAKLAAKDAASCSTAPEFGHSDAAAAGEAARQAGRNLMGDLFGATLDTAIVQTAADPVGAKCREEVAKRTHGAVDALWKLTLKQKKALLLGKKVLAATNGGALADGLVAFLDSDPKGAVSKPFAALAAASAKRCAGVDLAAAFPGCAPADLPALNACAERATRCRFCQVLAAADGLALDCDLFDNDTADLSCQQTP